MCEQKPFSHTYKCYSYTIASQNHRTVCAGKDLKEYLIPAPLPSLQCLSITSYCSHQEYEEYSVIAETVYIIEDHIIFYSLSHTHTYVSVCMCTRFILSFLIDLIFVTFDHSS